MGEICLLAKLYLCIYECLIVSGCGCVTLQATFEELRRLRLQRLAASEEEKIECTFRPVTSASAASNVVKARMPVHSETEDERVARLALADGDRIRQVSPSVYLRMI